MTQDAGSRPAWPEPTRRNVVGAVLGVVILSVAVLALLFFAINDLLVDRLWFESQDQLPVWDLRTFGRILLWIPVTIVSFLLLTLSIWLAVARADDAAPRVTAHPMLVPGHQWPPRLRAARRGSRDGRGVAHAR